MAQRTATKRRVYRPSPSLNSYLVESQRPLVILAFLVPFILLHELGSRMFHVEVGAVSILRLLVANMGIYGRTVPAVLVVLTLLVWHLLESDSWSIRWRNLLTMAGESFLFAIPIFAISFICQQTLPLTTILSQQSLVSLWALSLGAGVYEELLFRLYLCGAILLVCRYGLRMKGTSSTVAAVIVSSILFSLYHYLGNESFAMFSFAFRTLAGIYFAGLFSSRGFGITAGAHAFYDVIVVTLHHYL